MKNNKAFMVLSVLLLFSMSCSLLTLVQKNSEPSADQPAAPAAVDDSGEAKIVEGEFAPIKVDLPSLSKVSFTTDTSKTASVDFSADDSDVTLELIDSAGLTWKLFVPSIALGQPVTLKMTALKNIKSDNLPIEYKGGILLEPDGLKFRTPATLSVSGEGLKDELVFLTGAQDGSAISLTLPSAEKNSIEIEHFSSLVATDSGSFRGRTTLEEIEKQLSQQEKETLAMAKKYLSEHKNDLEVPVPPSIAIECSEQNQSGANDPRIDKFINDAMEPEGAIIRALLKIEKGKALLGKESNPASPIIIRLLYRLEKKANLLMKTYRGQPEKVIPVAQFAINVAKQNALLGVSDDQAAFLEYLGEWIQESLDKIIKEIAEQHDYKKYNAAWTVAKWASLLSSKSITYEDFINRIAAAMRFKLEGKFTFTSMDSIYETQSEIPLNMETNASSALWTGNSQGTFNYTFLKGSGVTGKADPFTVNATITKLDACKGEVTLSVDRFNPDAEVITLEGESATTQGMKTFWEYSFADKKGEGGFYSFVVPLHNMEVNAVDELLDGTTHCGNKCSSKFELKLIHTPQ